MTPFASVALFHRDNAVKFRPPRKEPCQDKTQARKSASRYWRGNIVEPDALTKIFLVQHDGGTVYVCERATSGQSWVEYRLDPDKAIKTPHIAACLAELGIDPADAPPPMPDVLEINGIIYRRDL